MPYMRNTLTSAVLGPMAADSPEYEYLAGLKDGSSPVQFPLYEDVPFQDSGQSAAKRTDTIQALIAPVAAGADSAGVIGSAPYAAKITAVSFIPVSAVTGANTNSRTLSVKNGGAAGAGTNVPASLALVSGTNLTANAANVITLSGTASNLVLAAGDEIEWLSTHVGTGIADPGGLAVVSLSRD